MLISWSGANCVVIAPEIGANILNRVNIALIVCIVFCEKCDAQPIPSGICEIMTL